MMELCRDPMHLSWVRQIISFRNKIMLRPDSDIVKTAMMENCDMAKNNKLCWTSYLDRFLHKHTRLNIFLDPLSPNSITKAIKDKSFNNLSKYKDKL